MPRRVTTIDLDDVEGGNSRARRPHRGPLTQILLDPLHCADLERIFEAMQGAVSISHIRPGEYETLRARLDMPDFAHIIAVGVWNPLGWRGYHFTMRGTYTQDTHNVDTAPLFTLRILCREETDPEKAWEDIPLVAWQRVVTCLGTPVYIEANWHPETGETHALYGLEHIDSPEGAQLALQGMKLLRGSKSRGRPIGTGDYNDETDFLAEIMPVMCDLIRKGQKPTQENVASYLDKSDRQIRAWLHDFGLSWSDLREQAKHLLYRGSDSR